MKTLKILLLLISFYSFAEIYSADKPIPDSSNAKYGVYEKNNYDLWLAKSSNPTPVVIYFHGGSFSSGDKEKISEGIITNSLEKGISVVSANYRLTPEVIYPQHYKDCARMIQYLRYNAAKLNIDPDRIAIYGSSAGACTALWIGFHDDMADLKNDDPVLRMSTRVKCIGMFSGQSTLEPDVIREIISELALTNSMFYGKIFGLKKDELLTPRAKELYKEASPVTHLTKDDPPVWTYYSVPKEEPKTVSDAIHHYSFGVYLKKKMDALNVECVLRGKEDVASANKDFIEFLCRHFDIKTK